MDQPIVNIVGDLVALGPIRRDLIPTYQRWFNQFEMVRNLAHPPRPMTLEMETGWYDSAANAASVAHFTIYERATWKPIGNVGLGSIDYRNGTADFGIFIGELDCRGKGYGTEATRLTLDYAFTALGLRNVMLTVFAFNLAGIRAYEKAGFREMGRRRAAARVGRQHLDIVYMDCVATEFESPVLVDILKPDEPR